MMRTEAEREKGGGVPPRTYRIQLRDPAHRLPMAEKKCWRVLYRDRLRTGSSLTPLRDGLHDHRPLCPTYTVMVRSVEEVCSVTTVDGAHPSHRWGLQLFSAACGGDSLVSIALVAGPARWLESAASS